MEKYGFFPSVEGDRKVLSTTLAQFFSEIWSNGVFNNGLKIETNDDMSVTLKAGVAFINGYWYINDSDKIFNLDASDVNQGRIDSIVLRFSRENRNIISDILIGAYADNPVATELERNSNVHELRLYKINVPIGTEKITESLIEDCRYNTNDCGAVVNMIQHLDTTEIFAQYESAFNDWFEKMKDQLSDDIAGNLQLEIDEINDKMIYFTEEETWEEETNE